MSGPLPDALRARFQKLIEEGLSGRAAALRLKLSPTTEARWGIFDDPPDDERAIYECLTEKRAVVQ